MGHRMVAVERVDCDHTKSLMATTTEERQGMEYSRDEHGNPLSVNQGYGIGAGAATKEQYRCSGTGGLHRSGSSSSSEDDGQGGRRKKKGSKEKVTEKLPGGHKSEKEPETGTGAGEQHEKKGLMEKIQEKLPGHHRE